MAMTTMSGCPRCGSGLDKAQVPVATYLRKCQGCGYADLNDSPIDTPARREEYAVRAALAIRYALGRDMG